MFCNIIIDGCSPFYLYVPSLIHRWDQGRNARRGANVATVLTVNEARKCYRTTPFRLAVNANKFSKT